MRVLIVLSCTFTSSSRGFEFLGHGREAAFVFRYYRLSLFFRRSGAFLEQVLVISSAEDFFFGHSEVSGELLESLAVESGLSGFEVDIGRAADAQFVGHGRLGESVLFAEPAYVQVQFIGFHISFGTIFPKLIIGPQSICSDFVDNVHKNHTKNIRNGYFCVVCRFFICFKLLFAVSGPNLMNKRTEKMDRLEKVYREFGVMMTEDRIYEDASVSYADICKELGVLPSELDEVLLRELGYTGEELMEKYRDEAPE